MVTGRNEGQRVLLRADIAHDGGRIVAHTTEISPKTILLDCPVALRVGTEATIALSFPRLLGPFEVSVRVSEVRRADGPGSPGGLVCEVVAASDEVRAFLADVGVGTRWPRKTHDSYRCLLVEDNSFIRDLFVYGMDKYGRTRGAPVSLALATDADQAWDMLAKADFDMAIIDYYLPTRNGSALIERMRALPRHADLPVVAISVGGAEAREASIAAGADLFLDKPIVMRDLFTTLDMLTLRQAGR